MAKKGANFGVRGLVVSIMSDIASECVVGWRSVSVGCWGALLLSDKCSRIYFTAYYVEMQESNAHVN